MVVTVFFVANNVAFATGSENKTTEVSKKEVASTKRVSPDEDDKLDPTVIGLNAMPITDWFKKLLGMD